jgi:hypothetical protein
MAEKIQPREAKGGKATIYWVGAFGALPHEVAEWRAEVKAMPGGAELPIVEYRQPKKRTWERVPVSREVSTVILDGWGHGGPRLSDDKEENGMLCRASRWACFDAAWQTDFYEWIDGYTALHPTSVKTLADYRGFGGRS